MEHAQYNIVLQLFNNLCMAYGEVPAAYIHTSMKRILKPYGVTYNAAELITDAESDTDANQSEQQSKQRSEQQSEQQSEQKSGQRSEQQLCVSIEEFKVLIVRKLIEFHAMRRVLIEIKEQKIILKSQCGKCRFCDCLDEFVQNWLELIKSKKMIAYMQNIAFEPNMEVKLYHSLQINMEIFQLRICNTAKLKCLLAAILKSNEGKNADSKIVEAEKNAKKAKRVRAEINKLDAKITRHKLRIEQAEVRIVHMNFDKARQMDEQIATWEAELEKKLEEAKKYQNQQQLLQQLQPSQRQPPQRQPSQRQPSQRQPPQQQSQRQPSQRQPLQQQQQFQSVADDSIWYIVAKLGSKMAKSPPSFTSAKYCNIRSASYKKSSNRVKKYAELNNMRTEKIGSCRVYQFNMPIDELIEQLNNAHPNLFIT